MTKFNTSYSPNIPNYDVSSNPDTSKLGQGNDEDADNEIIDAVCPRCLGEKSLKIRNYGSFPCDECGQTGIVKLTHLELGYKRRYFDNIRRIEDESDDF